MDFIMANIGSILIGLGALIVLGSASGAAKQSNDADDEYVHSPFNPCSPNYRGD
jgi:hypothetical protein